MNVLGVLREIKFLKNQLERKIKMRKKNFIIIPKNKDLEDLGNNKLERIVKFNKISEEINILERNISELRKKVLRTNIKTLINIKSDALNNLFFFFTYI